MNKKKIYYVYAYLDPNIKGEYKYKEIKMDYKPFYIGKGQRRRKEVHLNIAKKVIKDNTKVLDRKLRKIIKLIRLGTEPIIVVLKSNMFEDESYELEKELIDYFGKKDDGGILLNYKDGGYDGVKYSYDSRLKMSKAKVGKKLPEEHVKNLTIVNRLTAKRRSETLKKNEVWLENVRKANVKNIFYCQGWNKGKGNYKLNVSEEGRRIRSETAKKNFSNRIFIGENNGFSKAVFMFDSNCNLLKKFACMKECSLFIHVQPEKLRKLIKDKLEFKGNLFSHEEIFVK